MNKQDERNLERSRMRIATRGLHLKIIAMILLFASLILFLFVFIFFPKDAFADHFSWYASSI